MTRDRRDWRLTADATEDSTTDLVPHVVARVGTAVRTRAEHYDGAYLYRGTALFAGSHRSHLFSVACGRDIVSGDIVVGVQVRDNVGAVRAVAVFPFVLLLCLFVGARLAPGGHGLLAGLGAGVVLGFLAAFGVYSLPPASGRTTARTLGVAADLEGAVRDALLPLGVEMQRTDGHIAGLDDGAAVDDPEWHAALEAALGELAG